MCYRYKATTVALASLVSIAAFSSLAKAESELYVTGGVASFDLDHASPAAATFRGGWNWAEHFGAEIEGSFGLDSDTIDPSEIELDIESQIGAYLVGRVPVGDNASFFSRVGYARTEIDINFGASSQIIQSDGISVGFGGEYMFTDQFGIRGDYTVMDAEDGAFTDAISVFGVSGVFKFGGPE